MIKIPRPKKFNEPSRVISGRVPESFLDSIPDDFKTPIDYLWHLANLALNGKTEERNETVNFNGREKAAIRFFNSGFTELFSAEDANQVLNKMIEDPKAFEHAEIMGRLAK